MPKLADIAAAQAQTRNTAPPAAPVAHTSPRQPSGKYDFHETGIRFLEQRPRALLGDGMRLGKSRQSIKAATGRTLVVAPAMVLDFDTWTIEHQKWRPDLALTQASYHALPHKYEMVSVRVEPEQLAELGQHLAGCALDLHRHQPPAYDQNEQKATFRPEDWACAKTASAAKGLRGHTGMRFKSVLAEQFKGHWDTVIFDEAHHLKGHDTHWTKAAEMLDTTNLWLLSGTPFVNWAHELWMALRLLRPEDTYRGGPLGGRWRWIQKWFKVSQRRSRSGRVLSEFDVSGELAACTDRCYDLAEPDGGCEHWQQFREEELRDLWLRRTWEQVMPDLPPLVGADDLIPVSMTPNQAAAYRKLKKELLVTLEDGTDVAAWNKGGLIAKLRQVSTGLDVVSGGNVRGSGKLDAMEARLEGRNRPALVLGWHLDTLSAIERRLDEMSPRIRWVEVSGRTPSKAHRQRARQAFQNGDVDVMVGQVEAIAEGANLNAGDLAITVEHSWRPSKNLQVWNRLRDPNDPTPVAVDRLVARDTVDEHMQEVLKGKSDHFARALPPREFAGLL